MKRFCVYLVYSQYEINENARKPIVVTQYNCTFQETIIVKRFYDEYARNIKNVKRKRYDGEHLSGVGEQSVYIFL